MDGIVVKSLGGFYYVKTGNGIIYPTRARGLFRKQHISPVVGDKVIISHLEDETASLDTICERKNFIERPPVANVDKLFIVVSGIDPKPNLLLIDKSIAVADSNGIEPVLLLSKSDLSDLSDIQTIYERIGIKCITTSKYSEQWIPILENEIKGYISVFTGNSGVGKSTIMNKLKPSLNLNTGETSRKLGRGRHTTRHVELFEIDEESFIIDTPGFSTFELERYNFSDKETVISGFREFSDYICECMFTSCSHTCEKGCAVIKAVNDGIIPETRHRNYITMYNEVKDINKW